MAPGPSARIRAALPGRLPLLAPLLVAGLLSASVVPAVQGADPRNVDAIARAVSLLGDRAGSAPGAPPPADPAPGAPNVVFHGARTDRVVALTFDDGYAPANVRQIFIELTQAGVPATFFVNGAYLRWDPGLWRSIAAAGYPIGNHTVLHEDVQGRPPGQVEADLVRNARLVQRVTGHAMIPVFRPPYGYHDAASDSAAAAAGFPTIVLWDVTGGDASLHATDASVLAGASAGRPGSIVLLHAGPSVTPRILPALIAAYRARGFGFVTVPQLLGLENTGLRLPPAPGPATQPDPGGVAAPTPPAVAPPGDDRGTAPESPGGVPVTQVGPVATPGGGPAGAEAPAPAAIPAAAGWDAAPGVGSIAGPPEPATQASLARDAAWARGSSRDGLVAVATVALLGLLLLLGAAAGRRVRRGE